MSLESLDQAFFSGDDDLYAKSCQSFHEVSQLRMEALEQNLAHVFSLSWHDLALHGTYFGTMLALDCLGLHALSLAASPAGRSFVNKIATASRKPRASQTMVEVAGIGKIAVEEGVAGADKVVQSIKQNPSIPTAESNQLY